MFVRRRRHNMKVDGDVEMECVKEDISGKGVMMLWVTERNGSKCHTVPISFGDQVRMFSTVVSSIATLIGLTSIHS